MDRNRTVLVVDDEENSRNGLKRLLSRNGFSVQTARDGGEALGIVDSVCVDIALVDFKMEGMNGLELARRILACCPRTLPIIVTAYGTIPMAVQAMRDGVYDYLTKPIDPDELLAVLDRAVEHLRLREQVETLRSQVAGESGFAGIVGSSKRIRDVIGWIQSISDSDLNVLIQGETGTGKELVARAIHAHSPRKEGPFVAVNCAVLRDELLESELFGHVEGAFTGAVREKPGKLELADGGTLLLDDVDLCSPSVQAKLLRAIELKQFERLGDTVSKSVNVRIISTTNRNLQELVESGEFRRDLYYRLCVVQTVIPPLRERTEDIPLLIDHFIRLNGAVQDVDMQGITPAALRACLLYKWPGNVRELENVISAAVLYAREGWIDVQDLPPHIANAGGDAGRENGAVDVDLRLEWNLDMLEKQILLSALRRAHFDPNETARLLGVTDRTLRNKLQKHGIDRKQLARSQRERLSQKDYSTG